MLLNHPSQSSIINSTSPSGTFHTGGVSGSHQQTAEAYQANRNATLGWQAAASTGGTGAVTGGSAGPGAGAPAGTSPNGTGVAGGSGGAAGGPPKGGQEIGRRGGSTGPVSSTVADNVTTEVIVSGTGSMPGTSTNDMSGLRAFPGRSVPWQAKIGKSKCDCPPADLKNKQ